ncbi:uncharacterized protein LOC126336569 isoform X2 [Schistocerca gregaria]|nr:uncharacterized protein LOC126336569 isoform X2 [Schistocerca gregaria]
MKQYITALLTVLLLPSQVTEANGSHQEVQRDSVNETNCVNGDSVASAVSPFKKSYSQEDGNAVEIIKSLELDSSSVDFLMKLPGNDVSWVYTPPVSVEQEYKNEKHVTNYSLTDIPEFMHEDKEPFTASASEDAAMSVVSDQTTDKDFPDDFDFRSRILIGNLLLRETNKTLHTSPRKSTSENLNIKENDNFSATDIISSNQENDHESSLKLATRKKKKSRPFNHWDFGRRTKPPKNLTKEHVLFPKLTQPPITVPFKSEEESSQYSSWQQIQNTPMYIKTTAVSNSEEYLPYIQQNSLQSQQVITTDSEPHYVSDAQAYPVANKQQIPERHSEPVVTEQEEENYSRNTGYTPPLFFVARYVPGYKIISQPVVLNTQGHHTTPPVYVNTSPGLQNYPLIISQRSPQTPVPFHTNE